MASATMFTFISSDKVRFEVTEAAANMSQTIRHMIEDGCADGDIPLHNIKAKVLEYCNKHAAAASPQAPAGSAAVRSEAGSSSNTTSGKESGKDDDLASFDKAFIDVDMDTLHDLVLAANYLEVKLLLDLGCQKVADTIKDKTPEQIRQAFGIKNNFSPEEKEYYKEYQWAFE